MIFLFIVAVLFCVYTYALFPLLLHWKARKLEPVSVPLNDSSWPSVSIVIAAHNEAAVLPEKFKSLKSLSYPAERLECLFVSDGSTDETNKLLGGVCKTTPNWSCIEYQPAAGKPTALNRGVEQASGDIVVFMDARQRIEHDAVQALVLRLRDPSVGAVSGELVLLDKHTDDGDREAGNVGLYWRYEKWIRENESRLGSTTGATGALYAIRRGDFEPLDANTLLDDFDTPIRLLKQGKRTVFEPAARAFDQVEADAGGEFARKVRTLTGNYRSFARNSWLFDPRQNPVWWQFLSHKVFRLLVPYALMAAMLASLLGGGGFLKVMLMIQIGFYGAGLLGYLGFENRLSQFINLFLQLNAAAVFGAYRALRGSGSVRWKSS